MKKLRFWAVVLWILSLLMMIGGTVTLLRIPLVGILLLFGGILCREFAYEPVRKKLASLYKEEIVRDALSQVFDQVSFNPDYGISCEQLSKTELVNTGNRFLSNDRICASYHGVSFEQSDIHIQKKSGKRNRVTIFCGRWMIFSFPKKFSCDLQIFTRDFSAAQQKGGVFFHREERLSTIETENQEFNRIFVVRGNDQLEAFYLLTPHLIETLLTLSYTFFCPMMLLFTDGQLHVALHNRKDALEPPLFGSLDITESRDRVREEMAVILQIIEELNLNKNLSS